jgi:Family of unknown function (DUF6252)
MKKLFHILLSIFLICASCENDPSPNSELAKLPPATQSGKNTFGCLVNGKAWVTRTTTDALAFYQSGVMQISADINEKNRKQYLDLITLNGLTQGAVYDLSNDPEYEAKFSWVLPSGICFYEEENTLSGQLTITKLDQVKYIVSGLFEFTTVVSGCDTIKVTDGRFDLLYAP